MALKQLIIILIVATILGLGVNLFSANKIPYVGDYRELSTGDGPIIPPEADEGDPPFIGLDVAYLQYTSGDAIFVDARDPAEFRCGTIPGSINIPFEYMPEGELAPYFDSALGFVPKDTRLITFCGGEECDLSLHLARNLQYEGYDNVMIFFGGSREWENNDLEMERREDCGE
jgi:rhodanese-related sulfurtransferase